jgi:hypothetical protein
MKKPKGSHGLKPGGMKQSVPASPAQVGPVRTGSGAVPLSAPQSLKGFGHKAQDFKSIVSDRGAFKIKG